MYFVLDPSNGPDFDVGDDFACDSVPPFDFVPSALPEMACTFDTGGTGFPGTGDFAKKADFVLFVREFVDTVAEMIFPGVDVSFDGNCDFCVLIRFTSVTVSERDAGSRPIFTVCRLGREAAESELFKRKSGGADPKRHCLQK